MTRIHNESVWTTVVTLQIEDDITDSTWNALLNESITFLHDVDKVFSTFRGDSFINQQLAHPERLNFHEVIQPPEFTYYRPYVSGGFTESAQHAYEIVESLCVAAQWKSNGAFNAWRNGTYDPIGLVKGWAADEVLEIAKAYGVKRVFVNAGGDIACFDEVEPWRIAIENPSDLQSAVGVVEIAHGALCTSGTYLKGNHIDSTSDDFSSVTVSGPSAALADAYATAAVSDGLKSFEWFANLGEDWGVIAMSNDGETLYTHNWHLDDDFEFRRTSNP